jgi:hypothetical protein
MSRQPRHHRRASYRSFRWQPGALTAVLAAVTIPLLIVLLAGPGRSFDGAGWSTTEARAGTPLEMLAVPSSGQVPLALTGPRGITVVASLQEGRQRLGQVVEPGAPGLVGGGNGPGAGLTPIVARPAYLVARGLLAVRAPPASHS